VPNALDKAKALAHELAAELEFLDHELAGKARALWAHLTGDVPALEAEAVTDAKQVEHDAVKAAEPVVAEAEHDATKLAGEVAADAKAATLAGASIDTLGGVDVTHLDPAMRKALTETVLKGGGAVAVALGTEHPADPAPAQVPDPAAVTPTA
jgi:hypothetical protein